MTPSKTHSLDLDLDWLQSLSSGEETLIAVPVVSHRWEDGWWVCPDNEIYGSIFFQGARRTEVLYASRCPEDGRWLLISSCGRPWVACTPCEREG